jgi:hypothetical protein
VILSVDEENLAIVIIRSGTGSQGDGRRGSVPARPRVLLRAPYMAAR